ncbi:MAG: outer membrane lipoprotein chaperone LolA [Gammaproteobacteria bacterium]|nr:outer membrane lipoprotein chaperone LolA [Gammaproteobacteria bacterium]
MSRVPIKNLLAVTLLLLVHPLHADEAGSRLSRYLQNLTTLEAEFEQSVLNENLSQAVRSQGIFYLQRPDKFRWDYIEPERQQIVADGRQIWLYDPELEQVSVQSQQSALKGTPAALLISGEPVSNSFELIDIGRSQNLDWIELIPRDPESQFVRILLAFANDELLRMEMADKFGQVTRFQFHEIKRNPEFRSTFFKFVPPENTDIYNQ